MRLLAIDPGSEVSGWILVEAETGSFRVVDSGVHSNHDMLAWVEDGQGAKVLAIEMAESFGQAVWSQVFTTVRWTGRFQERWADSEWVEFVTRSEVKMHLCGKRAANDALIRQVLVGLCGGKGTKAAPGGTYGVKSHAWAALAVAVTCLERMGVVVQPMQRDLIAPARVLTETA